MENVKEGFLRLLNLFLIPTFCAFFSLPVACFVFKYLRSYQHIPNRQKINPKTQFLRKSQIREQATLFILLLWDPKLIKKNLFVRGEGSEGKFHSNITIINSSFVRRVDSPAAARAEQLLKLFLSFFDRGAFRKNARQEMHLARCSKAKRRGSKQKTSGTFFFECRFDR